MGATILLSSCNFGIVGSSTLWDSAKYAELRLGDSGEFQLLIECDIWMGLINPEHGSGYRKGRLFYAAFLKGDGPDFVDPDLHINGQYSPPTRGTINVDRQLQRVIIHLQNVVSEPGQPLKTEPSEANGTYPIRTVNHDPFLYAPKESTIPPAGTPQPPP